MLVGGYGEAGDGFDDSADLMHLGADDSADVYEVVGLDDSDDVERSGDHVYGDHLVDLAQFSGHVSSASDGCLDQDVCSGLHVVKVSPSER